MSTPADDTGVRVEPHGSCDVAPVLKSQWRNDDHWHTIWPEGGHWCYPTEFEAQERADEVRSIRGAMADEEAAV